MNVNQLIAALQQIPPELRDSVQVFTPNPYKGQVWHGMWDDDYRGVKLVLRGAVSAVYIGKTEDLDRFRTNEISGEWRDLFIDRPSIGDVLSEPR